MLAGGGGIPPVGGGGGGPLGILEGGGGTPIGGAGGAGGPVVWIVADGIGAGGIPEDTEEIGAAF
mgnify:CR=1 FL=1